ncbi:diacylglycerol/lipid kinase family protein [Luteithermobacter gelatinilyticus]|uniref:diacylglycerol/lipid kinase family protein n=1 Tax=Luteithermobacter gelatinilyticus TaxID=2582913 RepID=UPI001105E1F2|nr:diacylglycerol kinase family protein [Luteithermobacter gelatinilyticus]
MAFPSPPSHPQQFRKLLIVHNPRSGRRNHHKFRQVVERLRGRDLMIHIQQTRFPGHAHDLIRNAQGKDYDLVVVAGGDGTLNDVLSALPHLNLPFALIPLGTANVFAREIGLDGSVDAIVDTIFSGRLRHMRPGLCEGREKRLFALMVSCGLDSHVVHHVNGGLKKWIGAAAYGIKFLHSLLRYPNMACTVTLDGHSHAAASVIVSKGRYYGGNFLLAPKGDVFSNNFQVVIFLRTGRLAALSYAFSLLTGNLAKRRDVLIRSAHEIRLDAADPHPVQLDGDPAGFLPATIRLADDSLSCLVPEGLKDDA